jgi:putative membrane protein
MKFSSETIVTFFRKKEFETKVFIFIFYAVGIIGLLVPATFSLFVQLIPFALILSSLLLALFQTTELNLKSAAVFMFIFIVSLLIEMVGVNTGLPFGNYQYGNSLGIKLYNTPLLISLNWLLLIYITAAVFEKYQFHSFLKIIFASTLMVSYDLILEQVAPIMDMWSFKDLHVPINNYVSWFGISLFFHTLIKTFKIKTGNKLAWIILVSQFVFFLILALFLK